MDPRLFLSRPFDLECTTRVVKCKLRKGTHQVVVEESVAEPENPEGGDRGEIVGERGRLLFEKAVWDTNQKTTLHVGELTGELREGDRVVVRLDPARRLRNGAYHTVSHLISSVAKLHWQPEIIGKLQLGEPTSTLTLYGQASRLPGLPAVLAELPRYLGRDVPVSVLTLPADEAAARCGEFFRRVIPKGVQAWRVVEIGTDLFPPIPCGGVHAPNFAVIEEVCLVGARAQGEDLVVEHTCRCSGTPPGDRANGRAAAVTAG
jgi:Ser-tRNA(Ala) deacylase AlaX